MGIKVLRRRADVFSKRGLLKDKIKDFLSLIGGIPMEQINRKGYERSKIKQSKGTISKFFKGISENSRIFYNKYLRTTIYNDHLEVKRIKRQTLEHGMMEFMRRQ